MSYRRSQQENQRIKKLYAQTKHKYGRGVYYDKDKERYVRYYISKRGRGKWLRRQSNKKARKSTRLPNFCAYRRLFDYWWELF